MNNLNTQEKTIHITRGDMDCVVFGSGEKKFVLIAGMSMTGLAGLAGPVSLAYAMFAEEYTIYLFDRLKVLPEGYSVREMAADIAETMAVLGVENADFMGNSQGGMIAQYLAIDYPELVHSLVLSSTVCYLDEIGMARLEKWAELARKNDGKGIYREFFNTVYAKPDMALLKLLENTATDEQCRRYAIMAESCISFDSREELGKIKCPVIVFGSDFDRVFGAEPSKRLAELLNCKVYMYHNPSFGHAVCDEAPDFKLRMMEFFHSLNY